MSIVEGIGEFVVGVDAVADVDDDEVVDLRQALQDGLEHGGADLRPPLRSRQAGDDVEVAPDGGMRHGVRSQVP